jgi:hypothetical protein
VNTIERHGRLGPAMADAALDDVEDLRSTITVSRDHPSDVGQRQVFIRIDGSERVALLFGESLTTELEPGRHRLRVHNTLIWKTIEFAIEPGEHLEFIVINSARWWTAGMAGVLGAAPLFLKVEKRSLV